MTVYNRQTRCIDCIAMGRTTSRAAPKPGPRCLEHWREEKRRRAKAVHAKVIEEKYEITGDDYQAIYEFQGGCCAVCGKAKGISKMLAVDHEHNKPGCTHDPSMGCRNCVRCLACTTCNKVVLGRYDVAALRRAIKVLEDPPAQRVLKRRRTVVSSVERVRDTWR